MPRILIAEPNHEGHQYSYVRRLAEAVLGYTSDVVLAVTPEGLASPQFRTHLEALAPRLHVEPVLRVISGGMLQTTAPKALNIRRAVRQARPDFLYVPTADTIAEATGLLAMAGIRAAPRRVHAECLLMRLSFAYPETTERKVPAGVSLAALRWSPFATIHLIDAVAYDWIERHGGSLRRRSRFLGEPIEEFPQMERSAARRELGLPDDGRWLVLAGLLRGGKGIKQLLAAFAIADLHQDDRLLLAGPLAPEIRAALDQPQIAELRRQGRIHLIDKYLDLRELSLVLSAADVVCCPYPAQPHPASISLKAVSAGRPVLASDTYWLGYMVPRFNLGWTTRVLDIPTFANSLRSSLEQAPSWRVSEAARRLLRFHAVDVFQRGWTAGLRAKLGLPPDPAPETWEWVRAAMET